MSRAAVLDQPGLFDLPAEPEPRPAPARPGRPTHTPRPRRTQEAQAEECNPTCLVCGKEEGRGLCMPRCACICTHSRQPDRTEVCLVTIHVTAVVVVGAPMHGIPGRRLALILCPHCGDVHWHAATPGTHYRTSPCGQPYIVHVPRPRPGGAAR